MSTTTVDFNGLEADNWVPQMGSTINPVNPGDIRAMHLDGALEVIMVGPAYGGAIVTNKLPLPSIPNRALTYVAFDYSMLFTPEALALERNAEMDVKICFTKGIAPVAPATIGALNIADLSGQLCLYRNGMFQIDKVDPVTNIATWIDTGFEVGLPPVGVWIPVSHRYTIDYANKRASVNRIVFNGIAFDIPAALQNQSWLFDRWDAIVAVQIQPDENGLEGGFITKFDNIRLRISAQPIACGA